MIQTDRLHLVPFTREHYDAISANDNETLGSLLNIRTPSSWTEFADAVDALPVLISFFEKLNGDHRWGSYFIIHPVDRQLIGTGGYKGAPDEEGVVEIGYEVKEMYRNRGFATESASALISFAKSQAGIKAVRAHTLPRENHSVKVLQKCGMEFKGSVTDPDDGEVWRWELQNPVKPNEKRCSNCRTS
ncbi:MAG: GNAT family N-acetyltransferase [Bacteroidota bacterium]